MELASATRYKCQCDEFFQYYESGNGNYWTIPKKTPNTQRNEIHILLFTPQRLHRTGQRVLSNNSDMDFILNLCSMRHFELWPSNDSNRQQPQSLRPGQWNKQK